MQTRQPPETADLAPYLRLAASAGPGHLGRREALSAEQRADLAQTLDSCGVEAPPYLLRPAEWIDRRAKLFEAGDYPDKGVTVTPGHLAALAGAFDLPVPVLIEHAGSPLEIGYLTRVEAEGNELFGDVALTREANDLINRSGAHSLSLGLSRDLTEIREVSLVRKPRVEGARLFATDALEFRSEFPLDEEARLRFELEALTERRRQEDAERALAGYVSQGRLVPAQLPFARALLMRDDAVEFDGDTRRVCDLAAALIERSAPHALYSEVAPASGPAPEAAELAPDEAAFYRRHFGDLSLEEIAKRR